MQILICINTTTGMEPITTVMILHFGYFIHMYVV